MKFCPHCGKRKEEATAYCGTCGAVTSEQAHSGPARTCKDYGLPKKSARSIKVALALAVVTALCIVTIPLVIDFIEQLSAEPSLEGSYIDIEGRVIIQVWIHDDAEYVDIESLQATLEGHGNVAGVELIGKDAALERFTYMMQDSPQIVEQLRDNPLPRSLEVELVDTQEIDGVVSLIKGSDEILRIADSPDDLDRSVTYGQGIVETLLGGE
ncbi:MAG: permease-like cell division protein FtsX [Coriobacteriia bacterium]|nr:permease-like cell division protein FtsX [Coriobacteriia bacterium]